MLKEKKALYGIFKRIFDFMTGIFVIVTLILLITSEPVRNSVELSDSSLTVFGRSFDLEGKEARAIFELIEFNRRFFGQFLSNTMRVFFRGISVPFSAVFDFVKECAMVLWEGM